MAQPWDPFVQAYGLRPPRQLEGALLPQQLSAPEPPRLTMDQIRARQVGQPQMQPQAPAQQQVQPTVGGIPGSDLARLLGTASGAMANLPKNATVGQTLLALGGGLTAGQYGLDQQKRQERVDDARFGQMEQERAAEAEKNAAFEQYVSTLPPEQQNLLRAFGPSAGVLDRIDPKADKPSDRIFGGAETGYYQMGPDGQPVQIIPASPRGPLAVTTVQGGGPGETQYDKDRGGQWAATAGQISAAGQSAQEQLASLGPLMASLANPDVYQGTGGNAITGLKRFGRTMFGMDFEGVGDAEVVQTVGNQMALQMRSMLPGPMSNGDREFLRSLPPNLGNSREGNILVGEFFRRTAERAIERAAAAREYEARNGRLNAGFDVEWAERMEAEPMFDENDYAVLQRVAAESPQPSPLAGVPDDITELLGRYGGN